MTKQGNRCRECPPTCGVCDANGHCPDHCGKAKSEPLCFLVAMHPTKDAPLHPKRALLRIGLSESGRTVEFEGFVRVDSDQHLKRLVKTETGFPARLAERAKKKMAKEQPWSQITIVDAPSRKS